MRYGRVRLAVFLAGLVLLPGCGKPKPPPDDPASVQKLEQQLKQARQKEGDQGIPPEQAPK
jgi:hypothetical protein